MNAIVRNVIAKVRELVSNASGDAARTVYYSVHNLSDLFTAHVYVYADRSVVVELFETGHAHPAYLIEFERAPADAVEIVFCGRFNGDGSVIGPISFEDKLAVARRYKDLGYKVDTCESSSFPGKPNFMGRTVRA